jgi:hypothetical protein
MKCKQGHKFNKKNAIRIVGKYGEEVYFCPKCRMGVDPE